MSEEKVEFNSVSQYVSHLEESGEDTVATSEVVETLKGILSRPVPAASRRGKLAGIELEDMTDEQLKRELINSKSVLYKAQQREASIETIEKNQARVDAALAEKAKRTPKTEEADTAEGNDEVYTEKEEDLEI